MLRVTRPFSSSSKFKWLAPEGQVAAHTLPAFGIFGNVGKYWNFVTADKNHAFSLDPASPRVTDEQSGPLYWSIASMHELDISE